MLKAVVYASQTGFTEQYARMLAGKVGLGCYTVKEAKKHLQKGDDYIFMGWLSAGKIKGLKKACRLGKPQAVAAVGISGESKVYTEKLKKQNKLKDKPFFYLQGGFEKEKLKGSAKLMMKAAYKTLVKKAQAVKDPDEGQKNALELLLHGGSLVSKERLLPVIEWCEEKKGKK